MTVTDESPRRVPLPKIQPGAPRRRLGSAASPSVSSSRGCHLLIEVGTPHRRALEYVPRDANAATIVTALKSALVYEFNFFRMIQLGQYPEGKRLAAPTVKAWVLGSGEGRATAKLREPCFEGRLGRIEDLVKAAKALCLNAPDARAIEAAREIWPGYTFASLIRTNRRAVKILSEGGGPVPYEMLFES